MNNEKKSKIINWLELLRIVVATIAGWLGSTL